MFEERKKCSRSKGKDRSRTRRCNERCMRNLEISGKCSSSPYLNNNYFTHNFGYGYSYGYGYYYIVNFNSDRGYNPV